jgi:hypothetical protein
MVHVGVCRVAYLSWDAQGIEDSIWSVANIDVLSSDGASARVLANPLCLV